MASPETLDLARLLAPISPEQPAGPDLGQESVYHDLNWLRRSVLRDESRRRNAWESTEGGSVDWAPVRSQCLDFLATGAKHLWVAAWLTEASLRTHGLAGLRDGLRLIGGLVRQFKDAGLHPAIDGDAAGAGEQLSQLAGLDESLRAPLKEVSITGPGGYRMIDYLAAETLERNPSQEQKSEQIAAGAVTLEAFHAAAANSAPEFFRTLHEDGQECLEALEQLEETLAEAYGAKDAASFPELKEAIGECQRFLREIAPGGTFDASSDGDADRARSGAAATDATGSGGSSPPDGSRTAPGEWTPAAAFETMEQLARYFEKTQPQSPVPYLVRLAIRWGKMPLERWLEELLSEHSDVRDELSRRLGLVRGQEEE